MHHCTGCRHTRSLPRTGRTQGPCRVRSRLQSTCRCWGEKNLAGRTQRQNAAVRSWVRSRTAEPLYGRRGAPRRTRQLRRSE
eukprot:4707244-Prymnesium_polylepis.1